MKYKGNKIKFIFLLVRNNILPNFLESLVPAVVLSEEESDLHW